MELHWYQKKLPFALFWAKRLLFLPEGVVFPWKSSWNCERFAAKVVRAGISRWWTRTKENQDDTAQQVVRSASMEIDIWYLDGRTLNRVEPQERETQVQRKTLRPHNSKGVLQTPQRWIIGRFDTHCWRWENSCSSNGEQQNTPSPLC